jgi:uncharacterized protein YjbI with pentapeptide repeats
MANDEHVALLKQGVAAWNKWRDENPDVRPDLGNADLRGMDLREANLGKADLRKAYLIEAWLPDANLSGADLRRAGLVEAWLPHANLSGADLTRAKLAWANLTGADLSGAKLAWANLYKVSISGANLSGADLRKVNLQEAFLTAADLREASLSGANLGLTNLLSANIAGANLSGANLEYATLVDTDLTGANLSGCRIYGVSAWGLKLESTKQQDLVITPLNEPTVTVDNLEVAQFVYLLLHNEKIRDVIDTITSKAVLILGRFTDERKAVLDALREELRERGYLPIMFDFDKPGSRDTDETITLLARMAKFIIADVSDAKAVLQELRAIVPDLPSVPVQPIILATQEEPGMFDFYRHRPSVLTVHRYANQEQLLADLGDKVIRPAELKVLELRG